MVKPKIPIIMVTNDLYLPCAAVSICSMMETKKDDNIYDIFILHAGLNVENMHKVESMSRTDVLISFSGYISNDKKIYSPPLHSRTFFHGDVFPMVDRRVVPAV